MHEEHASSTALGAAAIRAAHQVIDQVPHILEDPISPLLLKPAALKEITERPELYGSSAARGLRSHVVLRSRYAEDKLREAIGRGVRQFVSLGAGYDTFAYRQPSWAQHIAIVEMDHPATQREKQALFLSRGMSCPENLEFVPVDFELEKVLDVLLRTSIRRDLPVWMSCLGVLAYLRRETAFGIFRAVSAMPRGSGIVFAFAGDSPSPVANRAADLGEPWLTRFSVEELKNGLRDSGLTDAEFLSPEESKERYYAIRTDLPAPRAVRLCAARS